MALEAGMVGPGLCTLGHTTARPVDAALAGW